MALSREEKARLCKIAQKGNYDATVALLDCILEDTTKDLLVTLADHRYLQGSIAVLKELRDLVVRKQDS